MNCQLSTWRLYLELLLCNNVLFDELVGVLVQDNRLIAYPLVHDGLCEHWLVSLVVTITSIAHLAYTPPYWLNALYRRYIDVVIQ